MTTGQSQSSQRSADPDSRRMSATADIAAEDWDLLYRAALEVLARVAGEKAAPDRTGVRLQAPGTVLRECMEALDQLRRSVPPHSIQKLGKSAHTEGEITSVLPAPASGSIVEERAGVSTHRQAHGSRSGNCRACSGSVIVSDHTTLLPSARSKGFDPLLQTSR